MANDERDDQQVNQDASPSGGEGGGRKRRRRRRRRGKGSGGGGGNSGGGKGPQSAETGAEQGAGGGRKQESRNRGGRRRGRGRRRGGDGGGDGEDIAPRERRAKPVENIENWEEIFGEQTFADLGLRGSVVKGCEELGFRHPTKIQADLIPLFLEGKDVLGQSRTGSGKTAAFGLPLLHLAEKGVPFQAIVLAPTRELAIQIAQEIADLGRHTPISVSAVYGGQRIRQQAERLEKGPEVIIATPGRLMDMVQRGHLTFDNVRFAVLDEVDRMLDIGFREDIRQILRSIKTEHQTIFVSATISEEIERLARSFMKDPEKLIATGGSLTVSLVEQYYLPVEPWDKKQLMLHLLTHEKPELTLVFCRMKRTVDSLTKYLNSKGIDAHAIHGDMYQGKRNSVMNRLRSGKLSVLVASDLAARGLDVEGISHVVNYDLPEDPEIYVHRIGRTARAGQKGIAWSFVTSEQGPLLTEIEKLTNVHIPELEYPDFEPGPVPQDVESKRVVEERRLEIKRANNRYSLQHPDEPVKISRVDTSRFPGGVVPAKFPPRLMQGRVKTARSMKTAARTTEEPGPGDQSKPPS